MVEFIKSKKEMSEEDIKANFITPAIVSKGWKNGEHIAYEEYFTDGRIEVRGDKARRKEGKKSDYSLYYQFGTRIAIVEAKDNKHSVRAGLQQAIEYGEILDVPFVYSSNGDGFIEHDRITREERELELDEFPTREELFSRMTKEKGLTYEITEAISTPYYTDAFSMKTPRYYQQIAINRTIETVARGQKRVMFVMATGTGKTFMAFQIIHRLRKAGLAENTVRSYLYGVRFFLENYELKMEDLFEYKGYLLDNFKPKTVNLRLQGVNKYLAFIGHDDLKLKFVKVQQKPFLEDVISHADYLFLKRSLKKDGILKWHFVVWFLGATGARVSELIKLKVEHVEIGYFDIYSKGGKIRRLYIPKKLRNSCLSWLESENRRSGYLFLNKFNEPITARGVAQQLKNYADKYKMNPKVIYPHSFRHLFAKNFLAKYNDIALLADLMGHESIETTRIYLRKTATEQQNIVDKIVNW